MGLANRYYEWNINRRLKDHILRRIHEHMKKFAKVSSDASTDPEFQVSRVPTSSSGCNRTRPDKQTNLLDILIDVGLKSKSVERTREWLSYRFFMPNFPGIHTSVVSTSSILLDILNCPRRKN